MVDVHRPLRRMSSALSNNEGNLFLPINCDHEESGSCRGEGYHRESKKSSSLASMVEFFSLVNADLDPLPLQIVTKI